MKCNDILKHLFTLAPEGYAEEWDNVGLLVGSPDREIHTVCLAVDASDSVIAYAASNKADLLLSHHPMIFRALKKVTSDNFISRRIMELIRLDISYIAMHTNFDIACMGEAAAELLGLKEAEILSVTDEAEGKKAGFGRVGAIPQSMSLQEFGELVKRVFKLPDIKIFGQIDTHIDRAAILPGSGGSFICDALRHKAQVLITGDVSHHEGIDAVMQGLCIIDAGHYGIEKIFVDYMRDYFARELPELNVITAEEHIPFQTQ